MKSPLCAVLVCLTLPLCWAAWAQSPPKADDGPASAAAAQSPATTVEGLTVPPPEHREAPYVKAMDFIQSHAAPARSGQLARWTDELCVVTLGLPPAMNQFVTARVQAVAAQVGAHITKRARCKPNVEILFTPEPQKLVDRVAHEQSAYLGYHYESQGQTLKIFSRPIQAWYLTGTKNVKGELTLDVEQGTSRSMTEALGTESVTTSIGEKNVKASGGNLGAMSVMGQEPEGCAGSRFTHCVSSLFVHVLIVGDYNAMGGREIGPIADYVSLLALSQSRSLDGCDALPSILDLLSTKCDGRSPPDSLTDSDIAYLKALYQTNLETELKVEKSQIADTMVRKAGSADPR